MILVKQKRNLSMKMLQECLLDKEMEANPRMLE
jgi:hypothetical protein